jgi:mutator protein MutT
MLSLDRPEGFEPAVTVVGCYMEHEGRFVVLRRLPHKRAGDRWGLPAGKIEPGETPKQAMVREICEETGVVVEEGLLVPHESWYVEHPDRRFVFHTFSIALDQRPDVALHPDEHHEYRWVTPSEALELPLILDQEACIRTRYGL